MSGIFNRLAVSLLAVALGTLACSANARTSSPLPAPAVDASRASTPGQHTVVLAGGCFWGILSVFLHVKGVISATSGYSGGAAMNAE